MPSVVGAACIALLGIAAMLALLRIAKGPTMLDRVIAVDVLVAILVISLCVEAAVNGTTTTLPVIVVLAMVAFIGPVAVARYAAKDADR